MRILMFSWAYPPSVVGGLGKHVAELLPPLANLPEVELHLVTPAWGGGESLELISQATIHRVVVPAIGNDFYWCDAAGRCGKGQGGLYTAEGAPHIRIQNVIVGGK